MYDLFFLSYGEQSADANWKLLVQRFPHARRVDGVKGILAAHQKCAQSSTTGNFYVVDADNQVDRMFSFDYQIPSWDLNYVHLWYARNPVNDLRYGWGGIKLFPKKPMLATTSMANDMTTGFQLKIMPSIASTTCFNQTPWDSWRSGFREAAKLTKHTIEFPDDRDNQMRLQSWLNVGLDELNGKWVLAGAAAGHKYAESNLPMENINNWAWLQQQFALMSPCDSL